MPGYINNNLLSNEHIIYDSRPHWIVFGTAIVWTVVAFILFAPRDPIFNLMGYLITIVALSSWLSSAITYFASEYGVTNKRVLVKVGLIRRTIWETAMHRIEGVHVNQTVLGRILGYGTVIVCGIGGMRDPVYRVVDPLRFQRAVQNQVAKVHEQGKSPNV